MGLYNNPKGLSTYMVECRVSIFGITTVIWGNEGVLNSNGYPTFKVPRGLPLVKGYYAGSIILLFEFYKRNKRYTILYNYQSSIKSSRRDGGLRV